MRTNWSVITGGPCSGKTALIGALTDAGHRTVPESARLYIDEELAKGRTIEDIRANPQALQEAIFERKLASERALDPLEMVFIDRGLPDTLAYRRHLGLAHDPIVHAACAKSSYRNIFLLEPLPYVPDRARNEDPREQKRLHEAIRSVYEELGFILIDVPVLSIAARLQFVLKEARR